MSPEAQNIFEMPPHLFWGSCPFWAKLRMAGRHFLFFFFFSSPRQLEQVIRGVIGGDKALIQLGQVPPFAQRWWHRLSLPHCSSLTVLAAVVCLS